MIQKHEFWCWAGSKEPKRIVVEGDADAEDLKSKAAVDYARQEKLSDGQWVRVAAYVDTDQYKTTYEYKADKS